MALNTQGIPSRTIHPLVLSLGFCEAQEWFRFISERGQPSASPSPLEFKVQNNRSIGLPLMQRFWFGRWLILAENSSVFPATSLVTVSSLALDKKALLFLPNCSQLGAEACMELQTIPFVPVSGWLLITQGLVSLSSRT